MYNLLIIVREPKLRQACKAALRQAGFRVIVKPDIVNGLQMLNGLQPDLIVWDLYPQKIVEMKALSVLRQTFGNIPLILIVADEELSEVPYKMAEAVLPKSSQIDKLIEKIVELLDTMVPSKKDS